MTPLVHQTLSTISALAAQHGTGLVVLSSFSDLTLSTLVSVCAPAVPIFMIDHGHLHHTALENYARAQRAGYRVRTISSPVLDTDATCHEEAKRRGLAHALIGATAYLVGLRRSDSPARADLGPSTLVNGVTRYHPLLDWKDSDVERYESENGLPHRSDLYRFCVRCEPGARTECGLHADLVPA